MNALIRKNPTISVYHRVMGQILSDEGDQDEAINFLIDALRWDSKNGAALLMMGNILAKYKNDVSSALKYYDQALLANPTDFITFNNIGYNLMNQNKLADAKKYLTKALLINDKFPNALFASGIIAQKENDYSAAFDFTIETIRLSKPQDLLYQNALQKAFDLSKHIMATDVGKDIFNEFRYQLNLMVKGI